MTYWDQAMRYAVKLDDAGFCRWRLWRHAPHRRFRRWLDTRTVPYPGQPDRTCDTVAELAHEGGAEPPIAVVFELKAEGELAAYPQAARYALTLHDELRQDTSTRDKYEVVAYLVALTGPAARHTWAMRPRDCIGLSIGGHFGGVVFSTLSLGRLFADIKAGRAPLSALCWASVMQGGDDPKQVARWKRLAQTEPNANRRADYAGLAILFAERVGRQELWKQSLEGWNVEESLVVKEWTQQAEKRGEERAELRSLRKHIARTLELRFPGGASEEVRRRLETHADTALLETWLERAVVTPSVDAWLEMTR